VASMSEEIQKEQDALFTVKRGTVVTVVRGRKFPKGLTGKVFWMGEDRFGGLKLGVAMSERKDAQGRNVDVMWIASGNVEAAATPERQARMDYLEGLRRQEMAKAPAYVLEFIEMSKRQSARELMGPRELSDRGAMPHESLEML
jgi:hypothetical protein